MLFSVARSPPYFLSHRDPLRSAESALLSRGPIPYLVASAATSAVATVTMSSPVAASALAGGSASRSPPAQRRRERPNPLPGCDRRRDRRHELSGGRVCVRADLVSSTVTPAATSSPVAASVSALAGGCASRSHPGQRHRSARRWPRAPAV